MRECLCASEEFELRWKMFAYENDEKLFDFMKHKHAVREKSSLLSPDDEVEQPKLIFSLRERENCIKCMK